MANGTRTRKLAVYNTALLGHLIAVAFRLRGKLLKSHRGAPSNILFFPPGICIKASPSTASAEANTMELIRLNTSIPVPQVYCTIVHKTDIYMVMERIRGDNLAQTWATRSKDSRQKILHQLSTLVKELRSTRPPDDHRIANVDGGPIYDPRLPSTSTWGPFKAIRDFHKALRNGVEDKHIDETSPAGLRELVSFHNDMRDPHVLTHGDLSSLNILVRGDQVVGIIGWQTAGWLPPYWEYVSAWNVNPQNTFWQREVDHFLNPDQHALEMDAIRRKFFGDF